MSWHFSQALVAAYSAASCSGGEQSAPLKSMTTADVYLWQGKMTEALNHSQSGTTCEPSTADRGEELLTWFLEGFRVRTSAQPEKAQEWRANEAGYGVRWLESSVKFDRSSHSWKTHRCLWEEDLDASSVTWPKWGMILGGVLWERGTLPLPTSATESGFWPTPNCSNDRSPCLNDAKLALEGKARSNGEKVQARLQDAAAYWPTPRANDAEKRGNFDLSNPRNGLPAAAAKWPTPIVSMAKGATITPRKNGKSRANDRLDYKVASIDGLKNGQLNPVWVEWLMGWPDGWTDLEPLATVKFQEWFASHGIA